MLVFLYSAPTFSAPTISALNAEYQVALDDYIDVLEDKAGTLRLSDILGAKHDNKFAPLTKQFADFGFTDATIWLRFTIENKSDGRGRYVLKFLPVSITNLEVYRVGSEHEKIYDFVNRQTRAAVVSSPGLNIKLGEIEPYVSQTYYARVWSDFPLNLQMNVYSDDAYSLSSAKQTNSHVYFFGLLSGLLLLSFILFVMWREITFALLAVQVCFLIGSLRVYLSYPSFFVPGKPHFDGSIVILFGLSSLIMVMAIAIRLLRYADSNARAIKPLKRLNIFNCIALLLFFVVDIKTSLYGFNIVFSLNATIGLFVMIYAYTRYGNSYFLNYGVSLVFMAIIGLISVLVVMADVSTIVYSDTVVIWGAAISSVIRLIAVLQYGYSVRNRRLEQVFMDRFDARLVADQTSLLSKLAHEIRTPMSGIMGMTELMRTTRMSDVQLEFTDTIDQSGQELLHIIDDVTAFAHIQNGTLPIQNQSFSVPELLEELLYAFAPEAERRNVELIVDADQVDFVYGDPIRTRHVISNLMSFSISLMRGGEVVIRAHVISNELLIKIEDTGPGLSREELSSIFVDDENLSRFVPEKGGIGLPLSKNIAEALGGSLETESSVGFGTQFSLIIPVSEGVSPTAPLLDSSVLRDLRMLVVDDIKTCCDVVEQQASLWGMQVDTCMSGSEAFAMLRAKENVEQAYNILLVDYKMPGMNGLQLAEKIQNEALIDDARLVIIMLTGLNMSPDLKQAQQLGIRRIISKPLTSKALQKILLEELRVSDVVEVDVDAKESKLDISPVEVNVLLAEDNEISARVIERMLDRLGVTVQVAVDGEQALKCIQRNSYDLVLMDCEMPKMDGFEVTELVRHWEQETAGLRTPIIALTAHILEQLQDRIKAAGMDDQVSKPVRQHEMQSLLKRWIPNFREL